MVEVCLQRAAGAYASVIWTRRGWLAGKGATDSPQPDEQVHDQAIAYAVRSRSVSGDSRQDEDSFDLRSQSCKTRLGFGIPIPEVEAQMGKWIMCKPANHLPPR